MISFLSFLCLVFFLCLLTTAISGELSFYTPKETFFIDCGASHDYKAADGWNWIGDNHSKFFLKENGGASTTSSAPVDSSNNTPLFATARLSHSKFTYRFPVLAGTKFIRLHFYQSSYGAFHRSKASFSVKTDGHTFLSNFNVSLAADALDSPIISKEFVINFKEDQLLNIVFNPSDRIGDAHSFINGIEIVPMPDNLYYTAQDGGFKFIGQQNSFFVETDHARKCIPTKRRWKSLSPTDDTACSVLGMRR
ncbi:hypothetical protein AAG906_025667 [Vitis piasezkii]